MTYRVLGQVAPAANTDTTLYTVASGKSAVGSTLVVCNRGTAAATYRIAVRPAGAALANQHYVAYDVSIPVGDSVMMTIGITLAATDVVTVRASTTTLSFNLFGQEV